MKARKVRNAMKQRFSNWIWYLAGILLCLVMLTTHLTSGLYARYTTSSAFEDSARVAVFEVSQKGTLMENGLQVSMAPSEDKDYTLIVNNKSEVDIRYYISLENKTKNLPLTFTVESTPMNTADTVFQGEVGLGEQATYNLKITWPAGENDLARMGMVDLVLVKLTAEQID